MITDGQILSRVMSPSVKPLSESQTIFLRQHELRLSLAPKHEELLSYRVLSLSSSHAFADDEDLRRATEMLLSFRLITVVKHTSSSRELAWLQVS